MLSQLLFAALAATTLAQSSSSQSSESSESSITLSGTATDSISGGDYLTGTAATYRSYGSTITLSSSSSYVVVSGTPTSTGNITSAVNQTITTNGSTIVTAISTATNTYLTASRSSTTGNATASSTSSSARPTNTQPCNGWPEFCNRKYSNITMIGAHNSPFAIKGNIASNQALGVTTQLNDGIRFLQFQVHKPNATSPLLLCHTSCNLLNAGTLVDYFVSVREWMDANPYEVVTVLMGNSDVLAPQNFTQPIFDSGLNRYLYTPPTVPMELDQWPTIGEMIITQNRLVVMLDYEANQQEIPWLLDEFANAWETPFSPTDRDFPCTQQRPPDQSRNVSMERLYIANHNLNVDAQLLGASLLVPAIPLLNETNAVTGYGSAGVMSDNCTRDWERPPNFILVDYYNIGSYNGSIFEVAANANDVTYNKDSCCGNDQVVNNAASQSTRFGVTGLIAMMGAMTYLMF